MPNAWNAGDDANESWSAASPGTARTSASPRDRALDLGRPLRVGQLPRDRVAERQGDRRARRRLPAVRVRPLDGVKKGVNRLVVRVDNAPARPTSRRRALDDTGEPAGGWWNYGGMPARSSCARSPAASTTATSRCARRNLPCPRCAATVELKRRRPQRVARPRAGHASRPLRQTDGRLRHGNVGAGGDATFSRTHAVAQPAAVVAHTEPLPCVSRRASAGRQAAGYTLHTGMRSLSVSPDGHAPAQRPAARTSAASACTRTRSARARRSTTPTRDAAHRRDRRTLGRDDDPRPLPARSPTSTSWPTRTGS